MDTILLSHGSGRGLSKLLDNVVLPVLNNSSTINNDDAAILSVNSGVSLAFTTDSFVVTPLEFPGGDIGKIAACGTINDLAMMGAVPRYLSVGLIIEEGLETALLKKYLTSLSNVCVDQNVVIACGDTKIVEKGKGDGLYINTSGIGEVRTTINLSAKNARVGDVVFVSGSIGLHGIAILAQREKLQFANNAQSDCAPLNGAVQELLRVSNTLRVLRDATRGGCAAVLNEIAQSSNVTIRVDHSLIPVSDVVRGACSFLGLDPLHIANEGTFIGIVDKQDAQRCIDALKKVKGCEQAAIIGTVQTKGKYDVEIVTEIGGVRPVEMPPGQLLPRIC